MKNLKRRILCLLICWYSALGAACTVWGIDWLIDDKNLWMLSLSWFAAAHWFVCAFETGRKL